MIRDGVLSDPAVDIILRQHITIDETALMYGAALLAFLTIQYLKTRGRKN